MGLTSLEEKPVHDRWPGTRGWGLLAWPCISGLGVIWSLQFPVYLPFTKEAAVMKYRLQVLALKDSTFLP